MKENIAIVFIAFVLVVGGAIIHASIFEDEFKAGRKLIAAVAACEASLPRDQECEPVYSAKEIEK